MHSVLSASGGAVGLQQKLWQAYQPFPSLQRISMWRARNSIPGPWVGAILWALAAQGVNPLALLKDA